LTTVVDPRGLAVTYSYSANLLANVVEPDGGRATFSYDGSSLLQTVAEPGGRPVTVAHDASSNVTNITDPTGDQRAFSYDSNHHLTNDHWSPLNTTYGYDSITNVVNSINHGLGTTENITPAAVQGLSTNPAKNVSDGVAVVVDGLNQTTTSMLDGQGRLLKK